MSTETPEFARVAKAGLQRSPHPPTGPGFGTQAPGEGYALGVAHREVARLGFTHEHSRHDVEIGVGLVAAKRASLVGRGPQLGDVRVVLTHFGLVEGVVVDHQLAAPFTGLAHSYVAQRRFVDSVAVGDLLGTGVVASL